MISTELPQAGKLLISEPFMSDPHFKRSVVYLAEYNQHGTVGFVLNQRSNFLLSDLVEECENSEYQIYTGGPVGRQALYFLHTLGDRLPGSMEISKGVYWGGDFEELKHLFLTEQVQEDQIKFFIGYSGWSAGQLDLEIKQNAWMVIESTTQFIFADSERELWKATVISMGDKYAPMVNFPEDPSLN